MEIFFVVISSNIFRNVKKGCKFKELTKPYLIMKKYLLVISGFFLLFVMSVSYLHSVAHDKSGIDGCQLGSIDGDRGLRWQVV